MTFLGSEKYSSYDDRWMSKTFQYQFNRLTQQLLKIPFNGGTSVQLETIASSTYSRIGVLVREKLINLSVADLSDKVLTVDLAFDPLVRNRPYPSFGSPTDYNAAGKIVIDTTSDLVDIQSAEMTGLVCGQPMTVKLVKRK